MNSTGSWRTLNSVALLLLAGCAAPAPRVSSSGDFTSLAHWHIEAEKPARVVAQDGQLDVDAPAGITLWFTPELTGPVRIEFEALAVAEGGANDQVSDLNVFWMATNPDGATPVWSRPRSGRFADYNDLRTYYVGLGGNRNTTSRFRRYIGDAERRPLLPEHDLADRSALLEPNRWQTITLVAERKTIEYWRDGRRLFQLSDQSPYTHGWFALRTTWSHLRIRALKITRPD